MSVAAFWLRGKARTDKRLIINEMSRYSCPLRKTVFFAMQYGSFEGAGWSLSLAEKGCFAQRTKRAKLSVGIISRHAHAIKVGLGGFVYGATVI